MRADRAGGAGSDGSHPGIDKFNVCRYKKDDLGVVRIDSCEAMSQVDVFACPFGDCCGVFDL